MCRMPLHMYMNSEALTTTTVSLNVNTGMDRVRVTEQLAYAVRHLGVAPRNHILSRIPINEGGALVNRSDGVIDATGPFVVPPTDEDDSSAEPSS